MVRTIFARLFGYAGLVVMLIALLLFVLSEMVEE